VEQLSYYCCRTLFEFFPSTGDYIAGTYNQFQLGGFYEQVLDDYSPGWRSVERESKSAYFGRGNYDYEWFCERFTGDRDYELGQLWILERALDPLIPAGHFFGPRGGHRHRFGFWRPTLLERAMAGVFADRLPGAYWPSFNGRPTYQGRAGGRTPDLTA
jgi:hypothetical protein